MPDDSPPNSAISTSARDRRAMLWLAVAVLIVFAPVLGHEFVHWDDYGTLASNSDFTPPTLAKLATYWSREHMDLYIPVTYSIWAGTARLAYRPDGVGLNPHLFHAVNLFIHIASALAVYMVLRRLGSAVAAALLGAMLFAVHPVQVEAVAWVSGMKDLLSGLLVTLATLFYLRDGTTPRPGRSYALATGLFVLAMLAKPSAVVAPLIVGAIDLLAVRRDIRGVLLRVGPWLALTVPVVLIGRLAQPAGGSAGVPLWFRPVVALDAVGFYLGKMAWPLNLAVDYGRSPRWLMDHPWQWVVAIVPLVMGIAVWLMRRRMPMVAAGAAVCGVSLLPVLGLVPFDYQAYSTVADHYLYTAMLGVALAAVGMLSQAASRFTWVVAGVLVAALAVRAHVQTYYWHDTQTLFTHTLTVNPDSAPAYRALGTAELRADRLDAAMSYLSSALALEPSDGLTHALIGDVLLGSDRPHEAVEHYLRAVASRPDSPNYLTRAGIAYRKLGQIDRAREMFDRAVAQRPGYFEAHVHLGEIALEQGDAVGAASHFRMALQARPDHPAAADGLRRAESLRQP
jgi:Tfp pilus assembly protein PilF